MIISSMTGEKWAAGTDPIAIDSLESRASPASAGRRTANVRVVSISGIAPPSPPSNSSDELYTGESFELMSSGQEFVTR
jgi:hypothetical protein